MKKSANMLYEEGKVLNLLGVLIDANIPLITASQIVAETSPDFKPALTEIHESIDAGGDMGGVFAKYSKEGLFSSFVPVMIRGGMLGGCLEKAFSQAGEMVLNMARFQEAGLASENVWTVHFYQLLGALVDCGIPLLEVLKHATSEYPPEVSASIIKPVREGGALRDGLAANPDYFTSLDCGLMEMGERTGNLLVVCAEGAYIKEELLLASLKKPLDRTLTDDVLHYHYLKVMFMLGATPFESLSNLSEDALTDERKRAFETMAGRVGAGETIGEAMWFLPGRFPNYISVMVKSAGSDPVLLEQNLECIVGSLISLLTCS